MSKEKHTKKLQKNDKCTLKEKRIILYIKAKDKAEIIKLDGGMINANKS